MFAVRHVSKVHINLGEMRGYRFVARWLATFFPDAKTPAWFDSRVLLGGIAKGRSPAPCMNEQQIRALPSVIGGGVYI